MKRKKCSHAFNMSPSYVLVCFEQLSRKCFQLVISHFSLSEVCVYYLTSLCIHAMYRFALCTVCGCAQRRYQERTGTSRPAKILSMCRLFSLFFFFCSFTLAQRFHVSPHFSELLNFHLFLPAHLVLYFLHTYFLSPCWIWPVLVCCRYVLLGKDCVHGCVQCTLCF